MPPLESLPKFFPVLMRHLTAYLDLFSEDAAELGTHVARRLAAIIVALLALCFAIAMTCVWILSAVWDTPWRDFAIIGLLLVFTVATIVAWIVAARSFTDWSPFLRLRTEWTLDRQLISELDSEPQEELVQEVPRSHVVTGERKPVNRVAS